MALRPDQLRQFESGGAVAAADIQHPLARLDPRMGDERLRHRRQHRVERLLFLGPLLAAVAVPKGDLILLQFLGRFHAARRRVFSHAILECR